MKPWDTICALTLTAAVVGGLLWSIRPAKAETRFMMGAEVHHGRGYSGPSVRFGNKYGVRLGVLTGEQSLGYVELDAELCGKSRWCFGAGVAYLTEKTRMNGTHGNFGIHVRYAIYEKWSVVFDHYSHGRALGIAKSRSNRGWNLLGVAYSF